MKIKGPIVEAFEKLKNEMWVKYRGCIIEKKGGKFIWMHKTHDTLEDAKLSIDEAFDMFAKK